MLTKIFIGTQTRTPPGFLQPPLCHIPYQGKHYVGLYLASEVPTTKELKEAATQLSHLLPHHGPLTVFPQHFVV